MNKDSLEMSHVVNFASRYNELKSQGLIPLEIRNIMIDDMGCCKSTYYVYLQRARELRIVTDSYAENRKKARDRQKAEAQLKHVDEEKYASKQINCNNEDKTNDDECITIEEIEVPEKSVIEIPRGVVAKITLEPKKGLFNKLIGKFFKK